MPNASTRRGPGRPSGGSSGEGREALLEAAHALMAERGLPRVTVREVAERAGLQPALVNYYFGGREGMLQAVVDRVASRLLSRITASAESEGTPRERLRAMLRAMVVDMSHESYASRLVVEQVLFGSDDAVDDFVRRFASRQIALLDGVLGEGRKSGEFRDVDTSLLAPQLLGGAIFFFLSQRVQQRLFGFDELTPERVERYADHFAASALDGICAAPKAST